MSVSLGPAPIATFLDQNGAPLAGGLVYTFIAGTNTQQATYTDSTGGIPNTNPIVLNAAGQAEIWFSALAYKIVVQNSLAVQQYEVDNFSVGVFATGNNNFTGNESHSGTETFTGPLIASGGGALNGAFTGNPSFTGSPSFVGTVAASVLQSTVASGTPPIIVASPTVVSVLNVAVVNGVTFPVGGSVGTVPVISAPNTVAYEPLSYKVISCQCSAQTVINTGTETGLYTSTINANDLAVNQVLRITVEGLRTSVSADGSYMTLRVKLDGATILTASEVAVSTTARGWKLETMLGCRTAGGTGNIAVVGGTYFLIPDATDTGIVSTVTGGDSAGLVAFDTTVSHTILISAQWSAGYTASESLTATLLLIERLG